MRTSHHRRPHLPASGSPSSAPSVVTPCTTGRSVMCRCCSSRSRSSRSPRSPRCSRLLLRCRPVARDHRRRRADHRRPGARAHRAWCVLGGPPNRVERMTRATACGHPSSGAGPALRREDPATGDAFSIARCAYCDLAQTVPAPSATELDRYYPRGYHSTTKRYRGGMDRVLSLVHRSRIRDHRATARRRRGSVLDIGCGPGVLLNQMRLARVDGARHRTLTIRRAAGARCLPSRRPRAGCRRARRRRRDTSTPWCSGMSPSISMSRRTTSVASRDCCGPGDPAHRGTELRIPRGAHRARQVVPPDVPRHLVHFTPATLGAMLGAAGFETVKVTHLVPEYDLFSFVQTVENRLGLPPNLLYDVLRRPEARLREGRSGTLCRCGRVALCGAAHRSAARRSLRSRRSAAQRDDRGLCGAESRLSASSGASEVRDGATRSGSPSRPSSSPYDHRRLKFDRRCVVEVARPPAPRRP